GPNTSPSPLEPRTVFWLPHRQAWTNPSRPSCRAPPAAPQAAAVQLAAQAVQLTAQAVELTAQAPSRVQVLAPRRLRRKRPAVQARRRHSRARTAGTSDPAARALHRVALRVPGRRKDDHVLAWRVKLRGARASPVSDNAASAAAARPWTQGFFDGYWEGAPP